MTKEERREYSRKWRKEHPDYWREWLEKNREHRLEYRRQYDAEQRRKKRERAGDAKKSGTNEFDAKPTVWKPEGCVWPDCFHCPYSDCKAQ